MFNSKTNYVPKFRSVICCDEIVQYYCRTAVALFINYFLSFSVTNVWKNFFTCQEYDNDYHITVIQAARSILIPLVKCVNFDFFDFFALYANPCTDYNCRDFTIYNEYWTIFSSDSRTHCQGRFNYLELKEKFIRSYNKSLFDLLI